MAFQKGHKFATGRPPGSTNEKTRRLHEILEKSNFDPFKFLIDVSKGDWQACGYESEYDGDRRVISFDNRVQAAKEVIQYIYAKQKSVEYKQASQLDGMTPQEKLEAMREAVKAMEIQLEVKKIE